MKPTKNKLLTDCNIEMGKIDEFDVSQQSMFTTLRKLNIFTFSSAVSCKQREFISWLR